MNNQERKDYEEKLEMEWEFERRKSKETGMKETRMLIYFSAFCILAALLVAMIS